MSDRDKLCIEKLVLENCMDEFEKMLCFTVEEQTTGIGNQMTVKHSYSGCNCVRHRDIV